MDAIIYTTNTGSTERYAKLLAQEIGLLTYSLTEAKKVRGNIYETLFWKHNYNRYNGNDSCPVGLYRLFVREPFEHSVLGTQESDSFGVRSCDLLLCGGAGRTGQDHSARH